MKNRIYFFVILTAVFVLLGMYTKIAVAACTGEGNYCMDRKSLDFEKKCEPNNTLAYCVQRWFTGTWAYCDDPDICTYSVTLYGAKCTDGAQPPTCPETDVTHSGGCCYLGNDDDDSCVPNWGPCSAPCDGGTQSDGCGNTRACNTQMCPPTITDFYIAKSLINMNHNATETMNQQTGIPFYIVLAMQMHLRKLPINWQVLTLHTGTCTASCIYVDKQGIRLQDGVGQPDDCQWHGNVDGNPTTIRTKEVQPQHQGIVTYTLTCTNTGGSDTKTFQVGVKLFSWREVLRSIRDSASQFTTDTHFGFASILDAIRMKLSSGR